MKLQYASDLHLEFPENNEFLNRRPLKPAGDILILAGDIVPLCLIEEHSDFFDYISMNFGTTYWLPGNHEYYHSDLAERGLFLYETIRSNIFLVNNASVRTGKLNLIFSTLWTRINPRQQLEIQIRYSDFHVIRNNGILIDTDQYNKMHEESLAFLSKEFKKEKSGKKIVVTHHMPTFANYSGDYKTDSLNEVFAVELSEQIRDWHPEYWIFGHDHNNKADFNIGTTRLVSNQLGYVMYNEHKGFSEGKVISV